MGFQRIEESNWSFGQIMSLITPLLYPKLNRKYRFNVKLNNYLMNLYEN